MRSPQQTLVSGTLSHAIAAKIHVLLLYSQTLHPRDFTEKYQLTQAQLADLLGVSLQLVKTWFARENPRQPEQRYLDRLSEIDALLEIKKLIDAKIPSHLRSLFNLDK